MAADATSMDPGCCGCGGGTQSLTIKVLGACGGDLTGMTFTVSVNGTPTQTVVNPATITGLSPGDQIQIVAQRPFRSAPYNRVITVPTLGNGVTTSGFFAQMVPADGFACGLCTEPIAETLTFTTPSAGTFAITWHADNKATPSYTSYGILMKPCWYSDSTPGIFLGSDQNGTLRIGDQVNSGAGIPEQYTSINCPGPGCPTADLYHTDGGYGPGPNGIVYLPGDVIVEFPAGCGGNNPYGGNMALAPRPVPGPDVVPADTLIVRLHANAHTGFAIHGRAQAREFARWGVPIALEAVDRDDRFIPVDPWVNDRLVGYTEGRPKFVTKASGWLVVDGEPVSELQDHDVVGNVVYTMWESSQVHPATVAQLNKAAAVVVPCRWNLDVFRDSGVTAPLYLAPLGIDTAVYRPGEPEPEGAVVFLTAGRIRHGWERKGIQDVIAAFLAELGDEPTAWLDVKVWEDDLGEGRVHLPDHPRIRIFTAALSDPELAAWYRSGSVYVSASRAEGWGFHPHQALACGRPVVAAIAGGQAEFCTEANTWPVEYDVVETPAANAIYGGLGTWFEPRPDSLRRQMRAAFHDAEGRKRRGDQGAIDAAKLSWDHAGRVLLPILGDHGLITDPEARRRIAILRDGFKYANEPAPSKGHLDFEVENCPFASNGCGCHGAPPRRCSHPDRPALVRQSDCVQCQSGGWITP